MNISKGFTLIELTVVTVLLAIVASTALPKYVSLSTQARSNALAGFQGSLQAANEMTRARYSMGSLDHPPANRLRATTRNYDEQVQGIPVTEQGYIRADIDAVTAALQLTDGDWILDDTSTGDRPIPAVNIYPAGRKHAQCRLIYTLPNLGGSPSYELKTTGC